VDLHSSKVGEAAHRQSAAKFPRSFNVHQVSQKLSPKCWV
jgi:hypothetical protein